MKERPILFSGPMVRAILSGQKTQTRRLVRMPRRPLAPGQYLSQPAKLPSDHGRVVVLNADGRCRDTAERIGNPYGVPGDRLWVRETWAPGLTWQGWSTSTDPATSLLVYAAGPPNHVGATVRATFGDVWADDQRDKEGLPAGRWRPSIHMPRWASRIDLGIAGVRVERLQDITEADILAEGVTVPLASQMTGIPWSDLPTLHHAWAAGWNHINADRATWEANPWVWVVEFKRVRP